MGGGSSPLNTGGGMSGGQTQMPNFATPNMQRYETNEPFSLAHGPFSSVNSTTQQDIMGRRGGGSGMPFGQRLGQLGFGGQQMAVPGAFNPSEFMNYGRQQPNSSRVAEEYPTVSHFGDMQYRPQQQQPLSFDDYYKVPQQRTQQAYRIGEKEAEYQRYRDNFGKPSGMQVAQPQPMRNPFQPDPSMVAEAYPAQSYGDMRYRPQPYNPYQQQMQQMRQMQQMQQYQQPMGLQGLMALLGGRGGMAMPQQGAYEQYVDRNNRAFASPTQEVKQPTMSRADFDAREQQMRSRLQPRMSMDMPYARGFTSALPTYFMKKGGKV